MTVGKWISKYQLTLIFTCMSAMSTAEEQLSYEDLRQLNATCPHLDTCSKMPKVIDNLISRSCECGEHCRTYDTCCVDSPFRNLHEDNQRKGRNPFECHKLYADGEAFFMVTRCAPGWRGDPLVRSMCESQSHSLRDPLIITPATNRGSGKAYKNYFCAMCHDDLEDSILWDIKVEKPVYEGEQPGEEGEVDEDVALKGLVFNENADQWGFFTGTSGKSFEPVVISFKQPPGLRNVNRECIPDLVSECHQSWKDKDVITKCSTYMGAIYATPRGGSKTGYRNAHCAICNYASYNESSMCRELTTFTRTGQPASFTVLLDVNPSDGEFVGRVSRCGKGESYDAFFKKCRALVCALPGYAIVNGKCVKQT